jgi:hypothetical protein
MSRCNVASRNTDKWAPVTSGTPLGPLDVLEALNEVEAPGNALR